MNQIVKSLLASSMLLRRSVPMVIQIGQSSSHLPNFTVFSRNFAAADKKKGKKQQAAPAEEKVKSDSLIPINIFVGMLTLSILN